MARSFVFERSMDVKILTETENSSTEFRLKSLSEIKKEVEDDQLDVKPEISIDGAAINTDCVHDDIQSTINSPQQSDVEDDTPHPKLVIKFHDLWKKSRKNAKLRKNKKKAKSKLQNDVPITSTAKDNEGQVSAASLLSENRASCSMTLTQGESEYLKGRTRNTTNSLRTTNKQHNRVTCNVTRSKKAAFIVCELCGRYFRDKKQLTAHKRYYADSGEHQCAICYQRFSRECQLQRHNKNAHSLPLKDNPCIYACELCPNRFEKKSTYIVHVMHCHNKHSASIMKSTCSRNGSTLRSGKLGKNTTMSKSGARRNSKRVKEKALLIHANNPDLQITADDLNALLEPQNTFDDNMIHESLESKLITDDPDSKKNLEDTTALNVQFPVPDKQSDLETCDKLEARTQIESSIVHSGRKSVPPSHVSELVEDKAAITVSRVYKTDSDLQESQKHDEQSKQLRPEPQSSVGIISPNVACRSQENLVGHLENTVGNWNVSEPVDPANNGDRVSGCSSVNTKSHSTDQTPGLATVTSRRTRSNTLTATAVGSPTIQDTECTSKSLQKIIQTEESAAQGKLTEGTKDNCNINKIHGHPDTNTLNECTKFVDNEQPDPQVGPVLSHELSENTGKTKYDAVDDDNNIGSDLNAKDDFGGNFQFINIKVENEIMSSTTDSISLSTAGPSSNTLYQDSLNNQSDDMTLITKFQMSNDIKFKDVSIMLVKLNNVPNVSMKNSTPESSLIERPKKLIKNPELYCTVCQKFFRTKAALMQHARWKHGQEFNFNKNKAKPWNTCSKVITNVEPRIQRKLTQSNVSTPVKYCYLCNLVFPNISMTLSHYLTAHTDPKYLECCICHAQLRNVRILKLHLYKHCTKLSETTKSSRVCRLCKKELGVASLSQYCSNCSRNSNYNTRNARRQFLDMVLRRPRPVQILKSEESCDSESPLVPLLENLPVSILEDRSDGKILQSIEYPNDGLDVVNNFKCLVCKSVFNESKELKSHLLTVHPNEQRRKRRNSQNLVKPRNQSILKSRDYKTLSARCHKLRNNKSKLVLRRKTNLKSKSFKSHDVHCKGKSSAQQKLMFTAAKSDSRRLFKHHHFRGSAKIRYDHKCNVCGLNCCCGRTLELHKKLYSTNGNNTCNICGLTFAWKHALVTHMKNAHNPKLLFHPRKVCCEVCKQGFYNKKFLRIHLAHYHKIKYFQCGICKIRFHTYRSLKNHTLYYSDHQTRVCTTCDQPFKCKYMLEYHRAQAHDPKKLKAYKYSCDICNCAFLHELLLQAHIGHFHGAQGSEADTKSTRRDMRNIAKHGQNDLEYPVAKRSSDTDSNSTASNLAILGKANEGDSDNATTDDATGKTVRTHAVSEYKCDICKLSFNDPYALLNHEWEYSNDGAHACDLCNRKFMEISHLKNHKVKHYQRNVVRDYECYICKEDFSSADHLTTHGLHLHGPPFVWNKSCGTTDCSSSKSIDSATNFNDGGMIERLSTSDSYDTIGLMLCDEVAENGKILLFQKIANNRSSGEMIRRNSNEDAHCCNFCKKGFSSLSLLADHVKRHAFRAYYANSLRYLCLICKNKFRTNDILRAHVIHCHTFDNKLPILTASDQVVQPEIPATNDDETNSSDTNTSAVVEVSLLDHSNQNTSDKNSCIISLSNTVSAISSDTNANAVEVSLSNQTKLDKNSSIIPLPNSVSPDRKILSSNTIGDIESLPGDATRSTSLPNEMSGIFDVYEQCEVVTDLACNDSPVGDQIQSSLKSVENGNPTFVSNLESKSVPEEVELFCVVVESEKGLQMHTCAICIEIFSSVTHFKQHFASVHVHCGMYICTFCVMRFTHMLDLKSHLLSHEDELKNYVCCKQNFEQMTAFILHKLSHRADGCKEVNQTEPQTQLLPLAVQTVEDSDDEVLVVDEVIKPKNCEVCDKSFPDFDSLLSHWDTCIDANALRCELCNTAFKSQKFLDLHNMKWHNKEQNSVTVQNSSSLRVNASEAPVKDSIGRDHTLRGLSMVGNPINTDNRQRLKKASVPSNELPGVIVYPAIEKIIVKPVVHGRNSPNNQECSLRHHEPNACGTSTTAKQDSNEGIGPPKLRRILKATQPPPSSKSTQILNIPGKPTSTKAVIKSSNHSKSKGNATISSTITSTGCSSLKNATSVCDKQVSNGVPSITKPNNFECYFIASDTPEIDEQFLASNDFDQRKRGKQFPPTLQQNACSSAEDSQTIETKPPSLDNIPWIDLEEDFFPNPEEEDPLNLLPTSSNTTENSNYYLCIQPSVESFDNTNTDKVASTCSVENDQYIDCNNQITSRLPLSLKPAYSPTHAIGIKPTSDDICNGGKRSPVGGDYADWQRTLPLASSSNAKQFNTPATKTINSNINYVPNEANVTERRVNSSAGKNTTETIVMDSSGTQARGYIPEINEYTTSAANHSNFIDNLKQKSVKQIVRCSYCNLSFAGNAMLIQHMESHKTENQCTACGFMFSNTEALQRHLSEHQQSTCIQCRTTFYFAETTTLRYLSPKPLKYCSKCYIPLPPLSQKRKRSITCTPELLRCGICMQPFTTLSDMTYHFKQRHTTSVCGICDKKFMTKSTLYSHMRTHDGVAVHSYQCTACKKYFIGETVLANHSQSHRLHKQYIKYISSDQLFNEK